MERVHSNFLGECVNNDDFFQNVEMVFLVDQNIESQKDQNVENVF